MLESVRALLAEVVDYAGLFPPAQLGMAEAVERFRAYSQGPERWMLGRFIVPAGRLSELETAIRVNPPPQPWRISVLAGDDLMGAVSAALAFNAHTRDAQADCLEARASSPGMVRAQAGGAPDNFAVYWEVPSAADPAPMLAAIAEAGQRAKVRTGGVRADAFPAAKDLVRFIRGCDAVRVPFKATAGLHHAIRSVHPLTYEAGSESCGMHGFLNVLLAAAFLWDAIAEEEMAAILDDTDGAFRFSRNGIRWRERWLATEQIQSSRQRLALSFGSCSFEEPVAELRSLGLI